MDHSGTSIGPHTQEARNLADRRNTARDVKKGKASGFVAVVQLLEVVSDSLDPMVCSPSELLLLLYLTDLQESCAPGTTASLCMGGN